MRYHQRKRFDTQTFAVATAIALLVFVIGCGGKDSPESVSATDTVTPVVPTPISSTPELEVYQPEVPVEVVAAEPQLVVFADAEAVYRARQYNEADKLFAAYVDQNPDNPWGFYMLGLVQRQLDRSDDAVVSFNSALEIDSLHAKSWTNLARANMDLGQPDEALDNIDRAIELSSESAVTLRLQGRAFHQLGQVDDAIAAYRQAIILDRDDAWSMNNLALIYIEQDEFEIAVQALARATQLDSSSATFHNNLGMALEQTERFRAAENAYRNALVADATYAKAATNLARVEHVEGNIDEPEFGLTASADAFEFTVSAWIVDSKAPDSPDDVDVSVTDTNSQSIGDETTEPADKSEEVSENVSEQDSLSQGIIGSIEF
ncbi:MAG: tetratricopeptide repeat protein [Rhodothermales bacterium]|nr:tetratricopeptide repeat protein [Rhodothermales bacterium]